MSMSVNLRWRIASPSHHAEWGEAMITQCEACRADHFVHADRLGQDSMHYPHGCSTRPAGEARRRGRSPPAMAVSGGGRSVGRPLDLLASSQ
jgi:hypothetical protein